MSVIKILTFAMCGGYIYKTLSVFPLSSAGNTVIKDGIDPCCGKVNTGYIFHLVWFSVASEKAGMDTGHCREAVDR